MNRKAIKKYSIIFAALLLSVASLGFNRIYSQSIDSDRVAIELLKRFDTNQDGFLTAEEIPPRSRVAVASAAKNAGMKINARKGISIEKLQKQLRKKQKADKNDSKKKAKKENKEGNGKKQAAAKPANMQAKPKKGPDKEDSNEADQPNEKSNSKGFGKADVTVSTRGFGTSKASEPTSEEKDGSVAKPEPNKKPKKDRYGRFAAIMMRRHDKDKSGVLEKNEWQKLKGPTKEYDLNDDDVLDELELRAKLVGFSTNPNNSSSSLASNDTASKPSRKKRSKAAKRIRNNPDGSRRSYRFKTAHERILEKVPDADWFVRLDRNEDGQIEMSEYANKWNATNAREFMEKDANNDGIITPEELQNSAE